MADRPARLVTVLADAVRTIEIVAWICTAAMGFLALGIASGRTRSVVVFAVQATAPFALAPALPIAVLAAVEGRPALAAVDLGLAAALGWLLLPVLRHGTPPGADPLDPTLSIVFANTLYENIRTDEAAVALLALDADVLAMAEYTPAMEASLVALGAFHRYPHRVGMSEVTRDGMVLLSRHPFVTAAHRNIGDVPGVDAVLDVDGCRLRVLVVHPVAPVTRAELRSWRRDLASLRSILLGTADHGLGAIVVGDYNAARWHPDFRSLLRGTGFRLAHEWLGRGFSTSWEIGGHLPAFVRIDHALVRGVVPLQVRDMDTPGSDHRAFVLTLAVPRSPA